MREYYSETGANLKNIKKYLKNSGNALKNLGNSLTEKNSFVKISFVADRIFELRQHKI